MRYNRIRKKLNAGPAHPETLEAGTPDRPKGMHEDTYNEFVTDLREARNRYHEQAFLVPLRRITGAPSDATEDEMNPFS